MIKAIKKYESVLIGLFFASILFQLLFRLTPQLLLLAVIIYALLITQYIFESKSIFISLAIVLSAALILFVYLISMGLECANDFRLVATFNYFYIAVLLAFLTNKYKTNVSKISYWLTLVLALCILVIAITPVFNINYVEFSWFNYVIMIISIYISEDIKETKLYGLKNLIKVIMIFTAIFIILDIKDIYMGFN